MGGVLLEDRRQRRRHLIERHVGADALTEAVAVGRAADVDVVGRLGAPDDADLGVVGAGTPVRASGHVQPDRHVTGAGVRERLLQFVDERRQHPLGLAERLAACRQGGAGDGQPAQRADVTGERHAVVAQPLLHLGHPRRRDAVQQQVLAWRDVDVRHRPVGDELTQRRAQPHAVAIAHPAADTGTPTTPSRVPW